MIVIWEYGEYSDQRVVFTDISGPDHAKKLQAVRSVAMRQHGCVSGILEGETWLEGGPQTWEEFLAGYCTNDLHQAPCPLSAGIRSDTPWPSPPAPQAERDAWMAARKAKEDAAGKACNCWRGWR